MQYDLTYKFYVLDSFCTKYTQENEIIIAEHFQQQKCWGCDKKLKSNRKPTKVLRKPFSPKEKELM
jgi:hypothetical protein